MKKSRLVLAGVICLGLIALVGSCATTKRAVSEKDFYAVWKGVWVNTEYPGAWDMPQKTVNHGNGLMEFYTKVERARPTCAFQLNITDKWIDSRGNIWYRAYSPVCLIHKSGGGSFFGKIDTSGNTWELIASFGNLPIDEWDPTSNLYYYRIYSRQ